MNKILVSKKLTFLFILIALVSMAFGDSIQIGENEALNASYPFATLWNYGWSRTIYLQSEIGAARQIDAVAFYIGNANATPYSLTNQKFFMKHTTDAEYTADSYVNMSTDPSYTLVFDGTMELNGEGWVEINLTTPFQYNGTENLIFGVEGRHGDYQSSTYSKFALANVTTERIMYDVQDSAYPESDDDANGATKLPVIKIITRLPNEPRVISEIAPSDDALNVPATNGNITWTFGANTTSYDLWFGPAGAMTEVITAGTPGMLGGNYAYSNLDGYTDYEWQVVSHNSVSGLSVTSGPFAFKTAVLPVTEFPYIQTFDPNGEWPFFPWYEAEGFDQPTPGSSSWASARYLNESTNTYGAKTTFYGDDDDWFISPVFTLPENNSLNLSYKVAMTDDYSAGAPENPMTADDHVYVMIINEGGHWNTAEAVVHYTAGNQPRATGTLENIDLSGYSGNIQIAFASISEVNNTSPSPGIGFHIDDFKIASADAPVPSEIVSPANGADFVAFDGNLNWTFGAYNTAYELRFGMDEANLPVVASGAAVAGTQGTFAYTALEADSTYYWQVVSTGNGQTVESPVWSFTTDQSTTVELPYYNNWDVDWPGEGWIEAEGTDPTAVSIESSSWNHDEYRNDGSATKGAQVNLYRNNDDWLISPKFVLEAGHNFNVSFKAAYTDYSSGTTPNPPDAPFPTTDHIYVLIKADGEDWSFDNVLVHYNGDNDPGFEGRTEMISLAAYTGTYRLAFVAIGDDVSAPDSDFSVDDFAILGASSPTACFNPSPENGADEQLENGTLTWEFGENTTTYDVKFGPADSMQVVLEGATPGMLGGSYGYSNLNPGVTYEWQIVSHGNNETVESPVWDFTTSPLYIQNPLPANSATRVAKDGQLQWEVGAQAANYDLYFGPTDNMVAVVTDGTIAANETGRFAFNDLAYFTEYSWKVVVRTANGYEVEGPVWSFTTEHGPVTEFPYVQDFNGTEWEPEKWIEAKGTIEEGITSYSSAWRHEDFLNVTGENKAACVELYGTDNEWLFTPGFILDENTNYTMKYTVALTHWNNSNPETIAETDSVYLLVSTDGTWSRENALTVYNTANQPSTTGSVVEFDLSAYSGYVKFAFYSTGTGTSNDADFFIDDFEVSVATAELPSACVNPTPAHEAIRISLEPTLSWFAGTGMPTGYAVSLWKMNGETQQTLIDSVSVTEASLNITDHIAEGLDTFTTYYWKVYPRNDTGTFNDGETWSFTTAWNTNYGGGDEEVSGGYYFANSLAGDALNNAPTYTWYDNQPGGANEGTHLPNTDFASLTGTANNDDAVSITMDIFDDASAFTFFDNTYTQFYINSNGTINFIAEGDEKWKERAPRYLPSNETINTNHDWHNFIAWCLDDLEYDTERSSEISINISKLTNGTCITFWKYLVYGSGTDNLKYVSAQVWLMKNGDIKINYNAENSNYDFTTEVHTIGIENVDGTKGITYRYNDVTGPMFDGDNGLAVAFSQNPFAVPYSFTSFTGVYDNTNAQVALTWTTELENGLSGYKVLRSIDDNLANAEVISGADVIAANNVATESTYNFSDTNYAADTQYFYWIQVIDATDQVIGTEGNITVTTTATDATDASQFKTALNGNYPNPFNPTTKIQYSLEKDSHVNLVIYNVRGQKVKTLINEKVEKGKNKTVVWNGVGDNGNKVASGIYFYKMKTSRYTSTKKMILLK